MRTLLYVDDEETDVFLLRHTLEKMGLVDVLRAVDDGAEAINYLAGEGRFADRETFPAPAVVLLDLNLPRVNGLEVLQWMRSHAQYASLPVIVFSSSVRTADEADALRLGATGYTVKPRRLDELQTIAQKIAQRWLLKEQGQ